MTGEDSRTIRNRVLPWAPAAVALGLVALAVVIGDEARRVADEAALAAAAATASATSAETLAGEAARKAADAMASAETAENAAAEALERTRRVANEAALAAADATASATSAETLAGEAARKAATAMASAETAENAAAEALERIGEAGGGRPHYPIGEEYRDCVHCPAMVVLPAGEFFMGALPDETGASRDEYPRHRVIVKRPFAVGKYEVTFDEWDACARAGECVEAASRVRRRGRRPVTHVSWGEAKAYVQWLHNQTGKPYRLLTEAEWEYAARAGALTPFHTGHTITAGQAAYALGVTRSAGTAPTGSFPPNGFGLYDMHGNVAEWVEDCYHAYPDFRVDTAPVVAAGCTRRIVRGGSAYDRELRTASARRRSVEPVSRSMAVGFRVASALPRPVAP